MAREYFLLDYFEDLSRDTSYTTGRMFGCLTIFFRGKMVVVIAESPGEKTYRGKRYKFDLWDGVMWPTSREFQNSLLEEFPNLCPHPVLGKWLYLPRQSEDFEESIQTLVRLIRRNDPRLGIVPGEKKETKSKKTTKLKKTDKIQTKKAKTTKKKIASRS